MTFEEYVSLVHDALVSLADAQYATILIQDYEVELRQARTSNTTAADCAAEIYHTDRDFAHEG